MWEIETWKTGGGPDPTATRTTVEEGGDDQRPSQPKNTKKNEVGEAEPFLADLCMVRCHKCVHDVAVCLSQPGKDIITSPCHGKTDQCLSFEKGKNCFRDIL